jgi:hypothetical protein
MPAIMPEDGKTGPGEYASEAETQDRYLSEKLTEIRRRHDAGEITPRQMANERVAAHVHHLAAIRALNREYFDVVPFPGERSST